MNPEVLKPIAERKSAFAFDPKPIPQSKIDLLFEAASLAPSSYNEQPWHFFYASRSNPDSFKRLLSVLMPPNQEWAQDASLLIVVAAKRVSGNSGKENHYAMHDTALAEASLMLQAQHMGLITHIMGGFSQSKARDVASITDEYQVVAAIAVGYPGDASKLSSNLQKRANAPRQRKPLNEFVVEL